MSQTRRHVDDLRGASRLAVEATVAITDLVQAMHATIGGGPAVLGRPLESLTRVVTAPVYGSIRAVTQMVGGSVDAALAQLAPLVGEGPAPPGYEAVLAALNGVLGDYLHETKNALAIEMGLRHAGRALVLEKDALRAAVPHAGGKLLVLVHGSCMTDAQWNRRGHDHGAALARDLGYTPVYLQYNSGLHISTNGRALAAVLERLVAQWPEPVDELVLLGHSMGGLVARSACHYGALAGHAWRQAPTTLICLGSPHHGAPLERGGNGLEVLLGLTEYSAPLARLGRIRSAGVTDMRFGNVVDEDWQGCGRFEPVGDRRKAHALPVGVACYALAATRSPAPVARLASDGLVPVDSALGRCAREDLCLAFPEEHTSIAYGTGHLDLLDSRGVYATLRAWLTRAAR